MAIKLTNKEYCPFVDEYKSEFICDTDEDFANLPKCCTGSTAVSLQSGKIRVVNTVGEWVPFGE